MAWSTRQAGHEPETSLRAVDADLAASIDRLERVRADLPVTRRRTPVDLPTASGGVTHDLSEVDRTMLTIYAQVLSADGRFEQLDPDVDEPTRQRVAAAIAAATQGRLRRRVLAGDVHRHASHRPDLAGSTVLAALREIYNPAQIDVLERAYTRTAPGHGVP